MDPLRVTGSVGLGVTPPGFAGRGASSAPECRGNPADRGRTGRQRTGTKGLRPNGWEAQAAR